MKIKLNNKQKIAVINEFVKRLKENQNGAKAILLQFGINTEGRDISVDDVLQLRNLHYEGFEKLCYFLYPELNEANADDWNSGSTISLIGTILGGSATILDSLGLDLGGKNKAYTEAYSMMTANAIAQQEQTKRMILICVVLTIIAIATVLILRKK